MPSSRVAFYYLLIASDDAANQTVKVHIC